VSFFLHRFDTGSAINTLVCCRKLTHLGAAANEGRYCRERKTVAKIPLGFAISPAGCGEKMGVKGGVAAIERNDVRQ
jgi:hypothetical protein